MDKYHVGQKVRIVGLPRFGEGLNGKVFTVVDGKKLRNLASGRKMVAYRLDKKRVRQGRVQTLVVPERYLTPVRDTDQPSTWSDCAWKPNQLPTQPTEKSNGIRRRTTQTS